MSFDPDLRAHQEWLGYLQPVGLVVAPPALLRAQAVLSRNLIGLQQRLLDLVIPTGETGDFGIADLATFLRELLGWQATDLVPPPESLEVSLHAYGDLLRPTLAVPDPEAGSDDSPWMILIQVIEPDQKLDEAPESTVGWSVSPQERFERLLRDTGVATGLLCNGLTLRLVYAPKGELSGHLSFPVQAMTEPAGRSILGWLELLLCADRVFDPDKTRRLTGVMEESRKHQAAVSTRLAGQVLDALQHLLRGFQAADEAAGGHLLRELMARKPDELYGGLLTVLMRLVFLLYAEHGGLMPADPVYSRNYSIGGPYDRLRADAGNHPPTPWTSAMAPGPTCSPCSGWSTRAAGTVVCACLCARASCSSPAVTPSWRADPTATRIRPKSPSIRPRSPTAWSGACCRTSCCWTASSSPTARSTSRTSAASTRRSWAFRWSAWLAPPSPFAPKTWW